MMRSLKIAPPCTHKTSCLAESIVQAAIRARETSKSRGDFLGSKLRARVQRRVEDLDRNNGRKKERKKERKKDRRQGQAHLEDEAVEEEADGREEENEAGEREEVIVRRVGLALPVHGHQEPPRRLPEPHPRFPSPGRIEGNFWSPVVAAARKIDGIGPDSAAL